MQWIRVSEVLFGLVLDGKISAESIDPAILHGPYDVGIELLRGGATETDLIDPVGVHAINAARIASSMVGTGVDPYSFIELCSKSASRTGVALQLRPLVERLERGEDVDVAEAVEAISRLENGFVDFIPASQVQPEKMIYVPSHYPPLDTFVGGYPLAGLTIVAGITGTGKTTFLIELARRCARAGEFCGLVTLEMTMGQVMYRMMEVDPHLTREHKEHILLSDRVYDVDGVYAAISKLVSRRELTFVGIDYADMLVGTKEQSEQIMGRIYNTLAVLAKKIRVPVVLVAQYRRTDGSVPTIEDIRYSGRAEQAASMILLLYNQGMVLSRSTMDAPGNILPYSPHCAWIVIGKTRYKGNQPTSLGAIKVEWNDKAGAWGLAVGEHPWWDLVGKT